MPERGWNGKSQNRSAVTYSVLPWGARHGCAWVTVMGNMNTLAVASLADAACVIMAEGAVLDDAARKKAVDQEITVLKTEEPIFEAALAVWNKLQAGAHEEP